MFPGAGTYVNKIQANKKYSIVRIYFARFVCGLDE